ncbi:hypothetical protein ACIRQP_23995 [Streptomyces sp. NPDC102274]|uniref:hypothetical protein n=1 Tax=Streptomyces sp. NPDC102274 TaxID=3366151 RepID=UPI0037FB5E8B
MPDEDREGRDQRPDQVGAEAPAEAPAEAEAREAARAESRDRAGAESRDEAGAEPPADAQESEAERRRRRAQFLRELNEAKALRERVKPRQARAARMRQQMRMRTFRW